MESDTLFWQWAVRVYRIFRTEGPADADFRRYDFER